MPYFEYIQSAEKAISSALQPPYQVTGTSTKPYVNGVTVFISRHGTPFAYVSISIGHGWTAPELNSQQLLLLSWGRHDELHSGSKICLTDQDFDTFLSDIHNILDLLTI